MKYLIVFALSIFSLQSYTQDIEKYYDYNWRKCEPNRARFYSAVYKTDSGYVRKDYYIREKSLQMLGKYEDVDLKIANGYFRFYHTDNALSSFGQYVNGKKEGLWLRYYADGMHSDSTVYVHGEITGTSLSWHPNGQLMDSVTILEDGSGVELAWFDNGKLSSTGRLINTSKPDGTWKYYHRNGKVSSIESYSNGSLLNKAYFDEMGTESADTTNKDSRPVFPGGIDSWKEYLLDNVHFPQGEKLVNGDKAVVIINFSVDEEGKVGDVSVGAAFHPKFDEIARKVILNSPNWRPALNHNRKVKQWMRQPVAFAETE
jgi:antitoxin component YwqK of YwqJK toxin-antitoxin module